MLLRRGPSMPARYFCLALLVHRDPAGVQLHLARPGLGEDLPVTLLACQGGARLGLQQHGDG